MQWNPRSSQKQIYVLGDECGIFEKDQPGKVIDYTADQPPLSHPPQPPPSYQNPDSVVDQNRKDQENKIKRGIPDPIKIKAKASRKKPKILPTAWDYVVDHQK